MEAIGEDALDDRIALDAAETNQGTIISLLSEPLVESLGILTNAIFVQVRQRPIPRVNEMRVNNLRRCEVDRFHLLRLRVGHLVDQIRLQYGIRSDDYLIVRAASSDSSIRPYVGQKK